MHLTVNQASSDFGGSPCMRGVPCGCRANPIHMYYVYILISKKDNNFYIGMSDNLKRRMDEHQKGSVKSTKDRHPLVLLCYEAYGNKKEATLREGYLKSSDGKKDIRKRLKITLKKYKE